MNLKILIFPLLIFAIIVFSIWFLYPAYTAMTLARSELEEARRSLENINQKIQTAERLNEEIMRSDGQQKTLLSLLPAEKKEEEIVNELSDITFTQGMVVYSLAFESGKINPEDALVPAVDASGNPLVDPATGQLVYSETIPKTKTVQAKVGAIGDYDKIRGFLRKLVNLKKTNSIASIKIFKEEPDVSAEGESNAGSGTLKMDVAVDFKYLEKVKNTIDVDDGIFTAGRFNMEVLDEIIKTRGTIIPELGAGFQGRTNPFVL